MAGVAGPGVTLIYAYFTQDAGMWKKHGLDVRVVLLNPVPTLAQVARTGEVKLRSIPGRGRLPRALRGADAVIIAAVVNTLPYSLVAANGITKWADLKGKKIGISRIGSGTDTAIRLVCKKFGSTPLKISSSCKVVLSRAAYRLCRWAPWTPRWYLRPWI